MHKNATNCNETLSKWCKNKHGASKIIDTFETYHTPAASRSAGRQIPTLPSLAIMAGQRKQKGKRLRGDKEAANGDDFIWGCGGERIERVT
jgi:hypothetical protein